VKRMGRMGNFVIEQYVLHMDPCQPYRLMLLKAKSRSMHFDSEILFYFLVVNFCYFVKMFLD